MPFMRYLIFVLLAQSALIRSSMGVAVGAEVRLKPSLLLWVAVEEPLMLTATAQTDRENVILSWSIKNVSDKQIVFRDTNVFLDYKFTVTDQHNRPVQPTEVGQRQLTFSYFALHKKTIALDVGQVYPEQLRISQFFRMQEKGTYKISIERRIRSIDGGISELIKSNVVSVSL